MSESFKRILIFIACLIPIALVGGFFVGWYQLDIYGEEMLAEAIEVLGSKEVLLLITAVQSMGYAVVCGLVGGLLADKLGLWRSFKLQKKSLLFTLGISEIGRAHV